jgi:hypothetical protein
VILALYLLVSRTHVGRAMQAVSMDEKGAAISGIDPDKINLFTWGLSGGLGALGVEKACDCPEPCDRKKARLEKEAARQAKLDEWKKDQII